MPEDVRNIFDSYEFDRQDAVHLWEILDPVITKFHGDAEKFYCSFYDSLRDILLPNKFGGWRNDLKVQPCRLCNNKYMIASTKITNTRHL